MNDNFIFRKIPKSRIATFDIFSVGLRKHHVSALLEFDVTDSRKRLHDLRKNGKFRNNIKRLLLMINRAED